MGCRLACEVSCEDHQHFPASLLFRDSQASLARVVKNHRNTNLNGRQSAGPEG